MSDVKRRSLGTLAVVTSAFLISPGRVDATVGAVTPFFSYEAEAGTSGGGATIVSLAAPPTNQYSSPELEASGHAYVRLDSTGEYVEWTNNTGQNITAINVRECIPDSPTGGGIAATLNLYVDGAFRQSLNLNSMQTWLYENATNYNGNDQDPTHGSPRVFFDDVHTFINGPAAAPGSTIRLQKDATNSAAFYYIDVVELENPPPQLTQPSNSLSILSYGAVANDTNVDNSTAIQSCINAAQSQGKGVWIPSGTFYVRTQGGLNANSITIQGAGMWYSRVYRNMPLPNANPLGAIFNLTSCTVRNFALDANATSRAVVDGCGGAMDTSGNNWVADSIWTQHTMSGFWASGNGGRVQNCRLTSIWADGCNLNNVSLGNSIGNNLTSSNNFIRGTGDDAHAINSVDYNDNNGTRYYYTAMSNITVVNNTSIAPWGGKGQAIYGGSGHLVANNLICDTARYIGLGVGKFGVNGSDLLSATIIGNLVLRSGGNGYQQQQAAMMIGNGGDGQSVGTVANTYCASNVVQSALFSGVAFSTGTNNVFQRNAIIAPGLDGIAVGPPFFETLTGTAILNSNTVTGLNPGRSALTNYSSACAAITPTLAAGYSSMSGVTTETCSEGGQDVAGIDPGDWTAYNNANLTGVNAFVGRVAAAGAGGNIEIRLDAPAGTLVGICPVIGTGGSQSYKNVFCSLTNTSGVHAVYLVYTGSGANLFSLEFFGLFTAPQQFSHRLIAGNTYSLNALVNGKYVTADNGGTNALIAKSVSVGPAEQFQIVDAGGGNIGLLALVNGKYVCADNGGTSPLIANRTGVGSWETFTEFDAGNGNIALRAMNNGKYVSADNGGTNALIAKSSSIGTWESFAPEFVSGNPPPAPGRLRAIAGDSQVALNWLASPGATGYNLKRSTSSGGTYINIASNISQTSFTNTGLINGTTWYYVVSGLNPAGESTNSPYVSAIPGSLNRSGWVASASASDSGSPPGNAIDGNINTRWTTGTPQANGQWFQVDMDSTNAIYKLVLDAASSSSDYPRGYQVTLSNDGTAWGSIVASGSGSSAVTTITFPTNTARYVRVTQTGSVGGLWWSIHEFNVFGRIGTVSTTPPQLTLGISNGNLQFSWPADHIGWRLEAQTNPASAGLGTNWQTVFGSAGTNQIWIPIDRNKGNVFFRLGHP